ncbi:MAG TPA: RNA polymerase sigma factor RpoH [Gammaproteobacteria bacterium]|nr:RNA polymerase sigma factor RpoH [Gammaproteobacteria bacterium]
MTTAMTLPVEAAESASMAGFLRAANTVPLLSAEEERDLAIRFHEQGDLDAARQLVVSHLRYVVKVARGFMGYGLPLGDLVQEGNIGLMKAVKRYDPDRNVRLVSFAVHWIRAEIYEYVVKNWRIVKVATTKSQRKLFFNLRKSRARLGWMKPGEITALADSLDVPESDVREMESRLQHGDVSFDVPTSNEGAASTPAGYLGDMTQNPESMVVDADNAAVRKEALERGLLKLDERSRDIIEQRWLSDRKSTLHELADQYGVSAERIRQLEKKAISGLQTAVLA